MYHDNKEQNAVKYFATVKGLNSSTQMCSMPYHRVYTVIISTTLALADPNRGSPLKAPNKAMYMCPQVDYVHILQVGN